MRPQKGNFFCWLPFQQIALKEWGSNAIYGNGAGIRSVSMCCNTYRPGYEDPLKLDRKLRHGKIKPTAKELFHGPEMTKIREYMLKGKKHPACKVCWDQEKLSFKENSSYRLNNKTPYHPDVDVNNPKLIGIDFQFDENCNLRCRMCTPGNSNKLRIDYNFFEENNIDTSNVPGFDWQQDRFFGRNSGKFANYKGSEKEARNWTDDDNEQWLDILKNINDLRYIRATGGETLIARGFLQFLDRAIEADAAKEIVLDIHSNCTKFTNVMIEKLNHFKKLSLHASIDSVGKNYEYIRYPMPWNKLDKSINNLCSKIKCETAFHMISVASSINAHYQKDLFNYTNDLKQKYPHIKFDYFADCVHPVDRGISLQFLPKEIKQKLLNDWEDTQQQFYDYQSKIRNSREGDEYHDVEFINGANFNVAISLISNSLKRKELPSDKENFLKELKAFDRSRDQDYRDFLHEDIVKWLDSNH